jgi:hypothetical protein
VGSKSAVCLCRDSDGPSNRQLVRHAFRAGGWGVSTFCAEIVRRDWSNPNLVKAGAVSLFSPSCVVTLTGLCLYL